MKQTMEDCPTALSSATPSIIITRTPSPNDPLEWPLWKRDIILAILFLASFFTTACGALLGTGQVQITTELDMTLTQFANCSGYWFVSVAVGGILFVPFARVWGKRHQYLLGVSLTFAGVIWNAQVNSYGSFVGARVLQGLGASVFEALLGTSIGDMYDTFQRGKRLAFTSWSTYAGGSAVLALTGVVVQNLGWRWLFWIMAIPQGISILLVFFFVPETTLLSARNGELPTSTSKRYQQMSYVQMLSPFQGRVSHKNIYHFVLRPFKMLFHPAALWFMLVNGATISWGTLLDFTMVIRFPTLLGFSPTQIGFLSFASLTGTILASVLCATTSDSIAAYMTKRNRGVYKPEYRLILMIPAVVLGFIAMYCFGVVERDLFKYGWFPSAFFYGMQEFSLVVSIVAGSAYIIDGFPTLWNEIFIMFLIVKNLCAYGVLSAAVSWTLKSVYDEFLGTSLVQLFLGLLTVPIYFYGPKLRSALADHRFFTEEL